MELGRFGRRRWVNGRSALPNTSRANVVYRIYLTLGQVSIAGICRVDSAAELFLQRLQVKKADPIRQPEIAGAAVVLVHLAVAFPPALELAGGDVEPHARWNGWAALRLEGGRHVLKELLLPAAEYRELQALFVARL
ncbi:MAG: hypothetical protein ABI822_29260 [Bryobacteraceae bacterium]